MASALHFGSRRLVASLARRGNYTKGADDDPAALSCSIWFRMSVPKKQGGGVTLYWGDVGWASIVALATSVSSFAQSASVKPFTPRQVVGLVLPVRRWVAIVP